MTLGLAAPAQASPGTGFHAYDLIDPRTDILAVAVGDVTGDAKSDVVATTIASRDGTVPPTILVYRQLADGSLDATPAQITVTSSSTNNALNVALTDLDGDHDLDLALTTYDGVQLFKQEGGTLRYARTLPAPDAWEVVARDVTDDGRTDLVVSTGTGVRVLKQTLDGAFVSATLSTSPSFTIAVGDVTGDGLPDVVDTTPSTFEVRAQAPEGFAPAVAYPALPGSSATGSIYGLAVGDTQGDSRPEVHVSATETSDTGHLVTWAVQPDGRLASTADRATLAKPGMVLVADVAGDSHADLVVGHASSQNLFTSSVGAFDSTPGVSSTETPYAVPGRSFGSYPGQMSVGDVNGDGSLDVVTFGNFSSAGGVVLLRGARAGESLPSQDFTPPETTLTGGPSGTIYGRTATFDFAADEPSTFVCSLDDAYPLPCTTGKTYTDLPLGMHTFDVAAIDAGYNRDATPAHTTFTVAETPPPPLPADVAVSMTASPSPVKKGTTVVLSTVVRNVGRGPAAATTLAQTVPDLANVSVSTDRGLACPVRATTATCDIPALAVNAGVTVTVRGTVLANKGTLTSTAQVTPTSGDVNTSNDSATVAVKLGNGQGN